MHSNELLVKKLPELDKMSLAQVSHYLDANVEHEIVGCVNWPDQFPYKPFCSVVVAVSLSRLYVLYSVISKDLRAVNTADLSPVAQDSCVEFFLQVPGSDEYWNFEFNCIGTLNASHRVERDNPTRLAADELASVERYSSCGNEAIQEQEGTFCWDIVVSIPLQLVGLDGGNLPDYVLGNFCKCGSKTAHPHYVTWSAIDGEKPDFHRPDCFGKLWLSQPEPPEPLEAETSQSPAAPTKPRGLKRLFLALLGKR